WGFTTGIFPGSGPVVGTEYKKEITFTIPTTGTIPGPNGWVKKHVELYAFVAYNGTDFLADEKMVLNAEAVHLSDFHKLGVNELSQGNVKILNAYPNPANANEVVNIKYDIANSEVVTMKVLNLLGQQVAQP